MNLHILDEQPEPTYGLSMSKGETMEKQCERALLARGAASEVVYCRTCKVFHLNVDALTVHFDARALRDLRDTVAAALVVYEHAPSNSTTEPSAPRQRVEVH